MVADLITSKNATPAIFPNTTLRQTIQLSLPASTLRLRFSNAFGLTDLTITSATIALPANGSAGQSAIQLQTLRPITFNDGSDSGITIAKGALGLSDPITFDLPKSQTVITVTVYIKDGQTGGAITGHPGSRTTSWLGFGDLTKTANITGAEVSATSTVHWQVIFP